MSIKLPALSSVLPTIVDLPKPPTKLPELPELRKPATSLPTLKIPDDPKRPVEGETKIISQQITLPPLAEKVEKTTVIELSKEIPEKKIFITLPMSPMAGPAIIISPSVTLPPLPSLTQPSALSPVILSPGSQPTFPGQGGLSATTDLQTLKAVQEGLATALLVEPEALFQPLKLPKLTVPEERHAEELVLPKITPTKLPTMPVLEMPKPPSQKKLVLPQIITSPETTKTVQLPTKRPKEITPSIRIPKIKSTAVKPSPIRIKGRKSEPTFVLPIGGVGGVTLPMESTIIPTIPITSPSAVPIKRPAKAKTTSDQVMENIKKLDPKRLRAGKTRKGDNSYTVAQLRSIAGSLNLIKSGNKKQLVDRIKAQILKVNPSAFD